MSARQSRPTQQPTPRPRLLVEQLEARILYSADAAVLLGLAGGPGEAQLRVVNPAPLREPAAAEQVQAGREIIFIDSRVPDAMALADELMQQRGTGHLFEIVVLDAGEDGVAQIGRVLAGEQGLAAIHVISHGSDGVVGLGTSHLDAARLASDGAALAQWGEALAADGDLLFYGCNVARGETGRLFVQELSALTGADVAASTDATGAVAIGGNWTLEFATGTIHTTLTAARFDALQWQGVLPSFTFTVTNTNDSGAGSLRQAILAANLNPGIDTIDFNIAGTGVHTITLASLLPTISDAVIIDATTDDSFAANGNRPAIVLNGNNGLSDGLRLYGGSDGSTVRGLVIQRFTEDGIDIASSNGNTIAGNWIGLNAAGTGGAGNQQGVNVWNASNNVIGGSTAADRNVISANSGVGVSVNTNNGTSTGNQVLGNTIGTNAAGTAALGNSNLGVYVNAAGNSVGGTAAGQGNVVSGTLNGSGVTLGGGATGTLVAGNLIGLNASGTAALGNSGVGLVVFSTGNTIGGTTAAARNVISGNGSAGISLDGASATGNVVVGNYIGTDISGSADVNGTALANAVSGVVMTNGASNNRIGTDADGSNDSAERNVISGNNWFGIEFLGSGTTGNVARGNYIGTDATGLVALGNSNGGVSFWNGASGNRLGSGLAGAGNVISGNGTGVLLAAAASNNKVQGNLIGLGADGSTVIGNNGSGVAFYNGGSAALVSGNVVGSDADGSNDAAERNVISANASGVVLEDAEVTGNSIAGNYIGTDATGLLDRGNVFDGVRLARGANANTIGGSNAVQRNVVSGNGEDGIQVADEASDNNVLRGNWIGVGAAGSATIANGQDGIFISGGADNTLVGGSGAGEGNWIAGNAIIGIEIDGASTGSVIQGNRIGTDLAGSANWGHGQNGVLLENGASGTLVGGTGAATANTIAFSGQGGVWASGIAVYGNTSSGNVLLRNAIYGNVGLGIDLGDDGVTANDAGDVDSGANGLLNSLVLGGVTTTGSVLNLNGSYSGAANTYYRIEVYSNTSAEASGTGEGRTYLGTVNMPVGASGSLNGSYNFAAAVPAGAYISATVTRTDASYTTFYETSEFSNHVVAQALPVNSVPAAQTTNEDTARVFSSANGNAITVSDADAGSAENQITLSVTAGSLTLAGSTGLTFITGDGTADATMSLRGTAAAINAALDGLLFSPPADYNGGATLSLATKDATLLALDIDSGLLGHYSFENAAALGADTSPAAGYNATVGGASAVADGIRGNVIALAGAGYLQTSGHYGNPANLTLAAWVNLTSADSSGADVISLGDSVALRLDNGGGLGLTGFIYNGSGFATINFNTTLAATGWRHVAFVFNDAANTATLYLDGTAVATGTVTGSISYTQGADSFIGRHGNGSPAFDFNGRIDEARVYNRALTAAEINTLASDQVLTATDTVAIAVAAVNDAPVITSNGGGSTAAVSVAENTSAVATATSTDVDGGTAVYSIVAGGDGARFTINASTGVLSFAVAPDHEAPTDLGADNVYNLTVQVSDGNGGTDTQAIAVTVTDVSGALVVTTTADTNDTGLGTSFTAEQLNASRGADAAVSLREALIAANNTAGVDTISFAIAGTGVHTINMVSALPTITDTVVLDASSDDSFAANGSRPAIVLDGNNAPGDGLALAATADGSTIRGLVVRDFGGAGILIAAGSDNNLIAGNYLGRLTGAGGDAGAGEANGGNGIVVQGAGNTIGGTTAADRNVLSGNVFHGVVLSGAAAVNNVVTGNYIGTDASGGAALGNGARGIYVTGGASSNSLGAAVAGAGNVISGNASDGIRMDSGNNTVQGNTIGLDAAGTTVLANAYGVVSYDSSNSIGGTSAAARNVISGNAAYGIWITGAASAGTTVQGNYLGTDASGNLARGNGNGVRVDNLASGVLIGGSAAGAGNVISANGVGVQLSTGGVRVEGNLIGLNAAGSALLGNGVAGITVAGAGSTGNAFLGNRIAASFGLGIDLGADGVTNNDAADTDSGANNLQNFPVLSAARTDGSTQLVITGSFNGAPNSFFRIEYFASATADASGYGEGQRLLGSANVATDATGNAVINSTLAAAVASGEFISATATRSNATFTAFTDTSEFAQNAVATMAPTASNLSTGETSPEDTLLNLADIVIVDADSANVSATLTLSNPAAGSLGTATSGAVTSTYNAGTGVWTASGAIADVNALLAALRFTPAANFNGSLTITTSISDGVAAPLIGSKSVVVTPVNDVPVNTVPATLVLNEDGSVAIAGLVIADPDAGASMLRAELTVSSGTLAASSGGAVTVTGSGSATLVLTGTLADLNIYLAGASRPVFTAAADFNGTVSLTMVTADGLNTGTGGTPAGGSIDYRFFDGTPAGGEPNNLPATGGITGVAGNFSGGSLANTLTGSSTSFGVVYTGVLNITTAGNYDFFVRADDQARLFIDGAPVLQAFFGNASASVALAAGQHSVEIRYVQDSGGYSLTAGYSGADTASITTSLLATPNAGRLVSVAASTAITVNAVNDAPVVTTTVGSQAFVEDAAPVVVDAGLTLTDVDSANLSGATVTISVGYIVGEDVLAFTAQNGISGSWNTSTGVLTLTGAASVADYQAALRSVTYVDTSDNPGIGNITVTFAVSDDAGLTAAASKVVTIAATPDTPVANADDGQLQLDGNDDVVVVAPSASLRLTSTMTLEAWINPAASTNAGQLILNKEGEYELAVFADGSLQYAVASPGNTWDWHNTGAIVADGRWAHVALVFDNGLIKTYLDGNLVDTFQQTPGNIGDSYPALNELRIGGRSSNPAGQAFAGAVDDVRVWNVARSQAEIRAAMGSAQAASVAGLVGWWRFDEASGSTVVDASGNGNDGTLANGATRLRQLTAEDSVLLVNAANGVLANDRDGDGDSLTVAAVNGNAAAVGVATTLASGAQLTLAADGSYRYDPRGAFDALAAGATTTDSFSYTVSDGSGRSATTTVSLVVTGTRDAPINVVPGAQATNEDTALVFSVANGNAITIADADAGGADNEITLSVDNGTLTLAGTAGLSFSAGDGSADATMTLRGSAAAINAALEGLRFDPVADFHGSAVLTLATTDSTLLSLDVDSGLLGHYRFDNPAALATDTSPLGAGSGTVNGAAGVADATRGAVLGVPGAGSNVQINGRFGDPANVTLAAWVNLSAADSSGAEVISLGDSVWLRLDAGGQLTGGYYNGSTWISTFAPVVLAGTGWHHVAFSFDDAANTATLYLDGVAVAQGSTTDSIGYTQGADSVIGSHGNNGSASDFAGRIDDARIYNRALTPAEVATLAADLALTARSTVAISVAAVNDAPAVATTATPLLTTENDAATGADGGLTLADVDAGNIVGATVGFSAGYVAGQDTLAFVDQAGISGSWNATTGVLTLAGSATLADYETALRSVTYANNADNPALATRTLVFAVVDDGGATSNTATRDIAVAPANDAPVLAGAALAMAVAEDAGVPVGAVGSLLSAFTAGISDVDGTAARGIAIVAGNNSNGSWYFSTDGGNQWNALGAVGASASLLLADSGLTRLYFAPNADFNGAASAALTVRAWDQSSGSAGSRVDTTANGGATAFSATSATIGVAVTAVNDAPTGAAGIVGTPMAGQTLSADTTNLVDVDGLGSFAYQWLRDGVAVGGATAANYTVGSADVGSQIALRVGYTDGQGTVESLDSAPTAAVTAVVVTPVTPVLPPAPTTPPGGGDMTPNPLPSVAPTQFDAGSAVAPLAAAAPAADTPLALADHAPAKAATELPAEAMQTELTAARARAGMAEAQRSSRAGSAGSERPNGGSDYLDTLVRLAVDEAQIGTLKLQDLVLTSTASGRPGTWSRAAANGNGVDPWGGDEAGPGLTLAETATASGLALTAGTVWWALRAGGLLTSLVVSMPAWRHADLLAVLPDDEDADDWDLADDGEASRDEEAVGELLDAGPDAVAMVERE